MKRLLCLVVMVVCVGAMSASLVMAQPEARGFGFGGPMAMGFFPDMTGINTFLSENGLPSMGEFLCGAGGSGRGGVIGGPAFGGIGWGIVATSEGEERSAEFVFGGGGFDIGRAIGGDASSVLTIGAVLGGGANILSVSTAPAEDGDDDEPEDHTICGLVIEPESRELGRAFGFVQPYVSMAGQFFPWMGFELRIGYLLPVFGIDFGDQIGIPAPSLDLSGPTVSFGITFGGIASGERRDQDEDGAEDRDAARKRDQVTRTLGGSFAVEDAEELVVENLLGEIRIDSYRAEIEGTGAGPIVQWEAVLSASERDIEGLQVATGVFGLSASVKTVGKGIVDYILRVPAGIDLKVKNGTGTVTLVGHEAKTIILENGVGEMVLEGVRATALFVTSGLGSVDLVDVDAEKLIVDVGIGEIALELDSAVSAALMVKAGLGDVSIDRFPGMVGGVRGFLGKKGDVTLGAGEQVIELTAGIGRINVKMRMP
ncbi:MAG: hypothetical protein WBC63_07330 [Candidatus Bipolaricaulia bacterium]